MAAKGGVQEETFSVLGSVPPNTCHLPLIQTLQIFSADSWTTPLSCCLLTTKHHSSPDGLNFTFYTLNVRRHLATVRHPDSSHNHCLGCHQVSLNSFFRYVEPASLLSSRKARLQAGQVIPAALYCFFPQLPFIPDVFRGENVSHCLLSGLQ